MFHTKLLQEQIHLRIYSTVKPLSFHTSNAYNCSTSKFYEIYNRPYSFTWNTITPMKKIVLTSYKD